MQTSPKNGFLVIEVEDIASGRRSQGLKNQPQVYIVSAFPHRFGGTALPISLPILADRVVTASEATAKSCSPFEMRPLFSRHAFSLAY